MKNLKSKIIFITMIMMMFGMVYQTAWRTNITRATTLNDTQIAETSQGSETSTEDEFSELLSSYESEAPEIESAELSSVFTSEKEIEVYLKTNRSDIKKVVISGWSGGVYKKYLTSKTATYDEMRNIYTVTFSFNEIVNTKTNEVEALETAEYYFDACVYGNNGTMSYANLDKVQYTKTGIITTTTINENNETEIAVTAVEDGYVAVLSANEEVTENLAWQKVKAGETTTMAVPETDSETTNTQEVRVLYKSGTEVTEEDLSNGNVTENSIMLLSDENTTEGSDGENISPESTSNYKDNDLFTFEFSENSGKNDWVSYEDTPNVLESRIQGMGNTTATATIKIHTTYPGILSFDYMVSSESTFDEFYFELEGAERTTEVEDNIFKYIWLEGKYAKSSGQKGWTSFAQSFAQPRKGVITLKLTYTKDSNINRNDDKAAIRNLKFTSLLPTNGEVIINNNSEFTNSTNLNLALSVDGASYVLISEDDVRPTATDSRWETLTATKSYTLKNTEDGEKTIYAWFKTETEAISLRAAKDTIKLDTVAPTNTAPTLESKAKEINVTLGQTDANELLIVKYGYRVAGTTGEYTWTDNIRINDLIDTTKYTISGLTEMTEYEIVTKVSDGASTEIQSNSTKIKTKIVSDGIVVTKSPATATTGEVTVTIAWNDTTYTHEYSLDNGATWTQDSNENTTIVVTENKTILYRMKNATYDTGDLECVVDNIDKTGPQVSKVQIVSPETGTYGIDDVITIQLTWDEEVTIVTAPTLNIKFGDGNTVAVTATEQTTTTITYKYTIVGSDAGYLEMDSLTGGLVKDSLNHEANYELPKATGSRIFVENVAYNVTTNEYFGSLQRAIKAAGTNNVTIKLVGNNELKDTVVINQGQNIKLDLNGKTISYESLENIVTAIENSGTLEIYDSTAEKAGKIVATSQAKTVSTIVNNTTGNLIIKDITIESVSNTNSVSLESYAVYNKGAGIVTLGANDSEISTTKPELKATAKNSYGLYIANAEGSINYYDGIIKGTKNATYVASGVAAYTLPAGYAEKKDTSKENNINYEIAYLSNEASVELTMNGITTGYKSILEALAKVPKDGRLGKIKMMTDEELEDIAKIYKGQNVEIDLNGHILTRTEKVDGSVYAVINNGTLKISDTSAVQTGEIKAISTEDVVTYAVYNYTDGDLTIEGGKLFASIDVVSKTNVAYGLENVSNNNIKMSGGEIYREGYFINPGKFETPNNLYLNQRYETIDEKEYKINYISSNPVIEMNVNGGTTYYSGIHQAMNSVPTDGSLATIKFLQNEEVLDTVEILKGQNVEIDLNGKELLAYNIDTLISNAGDLKISDMSNTKQGKLVLMLSDLSIEDSRRYVIYNKGTGNVEVNEIAIQNNSKDNPWNNEFYGIYNISKGNVIVNEGEIIINAFGGDNNYYYGIYNKNNGSIETNGGLIDTFTNTSLQYFWDNNSGICNENDGSIEVNGTNIMSGTYGIKIQNKEATVHLTSGEWIGLAKGIYTPEEMEYNSNGTVEAGKINIPENKYIAFRILETGYYPIVINYLDDVTDYPVELTINNSTIKYMTIQEAINNIPTDGTLGKIKLLYDINESNSIKIEEGQNIEIDLNGKKLYSKTRRLIENKGIIKINDTSDTQTGIITSDWDFMGVSMYDTEGPFVIYNMENGYVELNGGTIKNLIDWSYSVYNVDSSSFTMNGGKIISNYTNGYSGNCSGIYSSSSGTIEINGGTLELLSERGYGIINDGKGNIIINGGKITVIAGECYGIYNYSSGIVKMNGGIIRTFIKEDVERYTYGIYNYSTGTIEITQGTIEAAYLDSSLNSYGIYNRGKGKIKIGNNDGIIKKDIINITGKYGLYLRAKGGDINLYDGTIKGVTTAVYPDATTFETIDAVSTTTYVVNIPTGTQIYDGTENELKVKYLEFKEDYVPSGDEIIDAEAPYVSNIKVTNPESGNYAKGNIITFRVNWNEEIITSIDNVPELKIKFGEGIEKIAIAKETGSNYIDYEYAIEETDEGYLNLVSYLNGNVIDNSDNAWEQTILKLSGNEITAKTVAYISEKNQYYASVQQAINNCELNAENYTTIQLLKDEICCGSGVTINETQKIELDLNGNKIEENISNTTVRNNGYLKIIDTSEEKTGKIKSIYYGIYNSGTGNLEFNEGTIQSYYYGIYNAGVGNLTVNGGMVNGYYYYPSHGIYIEDSLATVYLTGGEWKGSLNGIYIPEGMIINNAGTIENGKINLSKDGQIGYKYDGEYTISYIKKGKNIVELTIGENITNYLSIHEAINNIPATGVLGKIKLLEDESLDKAVEINEGQNVEFDFNGKELYSRKEKIIVNNGNLKIIDTSTEKTGKIKNTGNIDDIYGIFNGNTGTLEINDITVEVKDKTDTYSVIEYGVYNEGIGSVKFNSGTISSNYGIYNNDTGYIEMNGGKISSTSLGIHNSNSGSIRINDGIIETSSISIRIIESSSKLELYGGEWKSTSSPLKIPEGMSINNTGTSEAGKVNLPKNKIIAYRLEGDYIVNYLEDITGFVAELTINNTTTKYLSVQDAIYNIPDDGTLGKVKLLENDCCGRSIVIHENQNVEIDLNGKEIFGSDGKVIENSGHLIITDNTELKDGKINIGPRASYGIYNVDEGTLVFNVGKIISIASNYQCYGVYNNGIGNIKINDGLIMTRGASIYNMKTGNIEINGGTLFYSIYNCSTGSIIINGGMIKATTSYGRALRNESTGIIEINGGTIVATGYYGIEFSKNDSYFYFNGGKIMGGFGAYTSSNKIVDLKPNTYIKRYREVTDDVLCYVAEIANISNIKSVNNGNITYYGTLSEAITATPTDGSLTQITLMSDTEVLSDITITSGQNILLDLNGYKINVKDYNPIEDSNEQMVIKTFVNEGTFEIMDSARVGEINISSNGYETYKNYNNSENAEVKSYNEVYGIYNNSETAEFKLYGGTFNVSNIGDVNAYGIYNHLSNENGVTVEGGNINVTVKAKESGVTSGKAYGIYSEADTNILLTGTDTNIVATSELNDSYGYYSEAKDTLILGAKDAVVSNSAPNIEGGTNGIYKTKGVIAMYDGAVTGPVNESISKDIDVIENNTVAYAIDNQDGTEITILLKTLESLEVIPNEVYFTELEAKQELVIEYLPIDATDVTIDYEVEDEIIAIVRMENDKYVVVSKGIGETVITFTATDLAGNKLEATCKVGIDIQAPTDDAPTATSTSTTITVICNQTDAIELDTNSIKYAISADNGVTWSEWTSRNVFTGLDPDTEYLVKTKASDMVGNEVESLPTTIRTKKPNNSTFVLEPDAVTKENVKVTITWNNPEGTPQYYKVGEDGEWIAVTGETTEVTVTENNVMVYTKLVYDGNEESEINYVLVDNIDRLAPKGTIDINGVITVDGKISLKITATDDAVVEGDNAGAVAYMYLTEENLTEAPSEADSNWEVYRGDYSKYLYTLQKENITKIYMWLKDKAGNISEVKSTEEFEWESTEMVMEWTIPVDADGEAGKGTTITLPIPSNIVNKFIVDWGDGISEEYESEVSFPTHTYMNTEEKVYTIQIGGNVNEFGYLETLAPVAGDKYESFTKYLTKLVKWGNLGATRYGFSNCTNLAGNIPTPEIGDLKKLTSLNNLFYNCSALTDGITAELFAGCENVTSFDKTFYGCTGITSAVIDVKKVGYEMFYGCNSLTEITITDKVEEIHLPAGEEGAFRYTGTDPERLLTTLHTTNALAINYDWASDMRTDGKQILKQPEDLTVSSKTEAQFSVTSSVESVNYQWYEVINGEEKELKEEDLKIYKSNIEGQANTTASTTITINSDKKGSLFFEYMVSSEQNNDKFTITVEDVNGVRTVVDGISGEVDWTEYSGEFKPNAEGKIIVILTYSKNGSIDEGLDYGAIRKLKYTESNKKEFTFEEDGNFGVDSQFAIMNPSYDGDNPFVAREEDGDIIFEAEDKVGFTSVVFGIKLEEEMTFSFDYRINGNVGDRNVNMYIEDGNGRTVILDGSEVTDGWVNYTTTLVPNSGVVAMFIETIMNNMGSTFAVKNVSIRLGEDVEHKCTFESEDIFTFEENSWSTSNLYENVNTSTLTIPAEAVTMEKNGAKYYCKVSNGFGSIESRQALLTVVDMDDKSLIAEWTIPVDTDKTNGTTTTDANGNKMTLGPQTTIKLPIPKNGANNYMVDWGDGSGFESYDGTADFPTHTYNNSEATTYTIRVKGIVKSFGYTSTTTPTASNTQKNYYTFTQYLTGLKQWGELESTRYGFSLCTNLSSAIPIPTEKSFYKIKKMDYLFYECVNLTGNIPENLFANIPDVDSFQATFYNCNNLTGEIPEKLFANTLKVELFNSVFNRCSKLSGSIPENLFVNTTQVFSFQGIFYNCTGLTGNIPENLFTNNIIAEDFSIIFYGCTGLTGSIPEKLFSNNINSSGFRTTFGGCTGLTGSIPANLFANTINASIFWATFSGCTGLTGSIPENLFANTTNATDFDSTFKNCENLTGSIPENLFTNAKKVTTFDSTFANCKNLSGKVPIGLFKNAPHDASYVQTFYNCSNITSAQIDIVWMGYEMFYGCNKLTDITIGDRVIIIDTNAFMATEPYNDNNLLLTKLHTNNETAILYNWLGDNRSDGKVILEEPKDVTTTENTEVNYNVKVSGDNLLYQWYEVTSGDVIQKLEDGQEIFKSNNKGEANSTAKSTIIIKSTENETISFEYMVSSEENGDLFTITIEDANGTTKVVDGISGEVNWTEYTKEFTPKNTGEIIITLIYSKNDSIDVGEDFGAIRNLKTSKKYKKDFTFEEDDEFIIDPIFAIMNPLDYHAYGFLIEEDDGERIFVADDREHYGETNVAFAIKLEEETTFSFDYRIMGNDGDRDVEIYIYDENGMTSVANTSKSTNGWVNYTATVIPYNGMVQFMVLSHLENVENIPQSSFALRNVGIITDLERTFTGETDDTFTVSNTKWIEMSPYKSTNTATLTIPDEYVTLDKDGNKYYCEVYNGFGKLTTRQALLKVHENYDWDKSLITKWQIPVDVAGVSGTISTNSSGEAITLGPQTTIKLPIPLNANNSYAVDWGDDSEIEYFDGTSNYPTHTYTNTAETTYEISVAGNVNSFGYYDKAIPTNPQDSTVTTRVAEDYYTFTQYVTGIKQWGEVGLTRVGFANCTNLVGSLPTPMNNSFENVTSFEKVFYACSNLSGTIPTNFFESATEALSFKDAFNGCKALTGNIPENLFKTNTKATSFANTFAECTLLEGSIPSNLFSTNAEVTDFTSTFENCSKLSGEIPSSLFTTTTKVTSFANTFKGCMNLSGTIPSNLFIKNKEALDFSNTFNGCSKLSGMVPVRLFAFNDKATNFTSTFEGCSSITAADIQINTENVTSMDGMFRNCTRLESVVFEKEFKNLTGAGMFENCSALRAVILLNQATTEAEVGTANDLTTLGMPSGTIIYVPYKENEPVYESVWSNIPAERIERIVQILPPNPDTIGLEETYIDPGYTVAGFAMDGEEAIKWQQYGFRVQVNGMPVDTSTEGSKWINYILYK